MESRTLRHVTCCSGRRSGTNPNREENHVPQVREFRRSDRLRHAARSLWQRRWIHQPAGGQAQPGLAPRRRRRRAHGLDRRALHRDRRQRQHAHVRIGAVGDARDRTRARREQHRLRRRRQHRRRRRLRRLRRARVRTRARRRAPRRRPRARAERRSGARPLREARVRDPQAGELGRRRVHRRQPRLRRGERARHRQLQRDAVHLHERPRRGTGAGVRAAARGGGCTGHRTDAAREHRQLVPHRGRRAARPRERERRPAQRGAR
ncbi:MAG: hypothetical protein MZV64_30160 [Ignavibacteriales bacterium]|nr:hypothetical protein [Ignavibacteriales bacterium]